MLAAPYAASAQGGRPRVLVTTVDGIITPVIADHLEDAVRRAERGGYVALVVRLDTPGGLDTAMRDIVQDFLSADVPVVVHVAPSGARAASAGLLITMAAHVAAMAPGTTIGASTPVALQGGEVGDKVINDAAAYSEAIARERGRDTAFARRAVTKGEAVTGREALRLGVVDLAAEDLDDLLARLDGRVIELPRDRAVTLDTARAGIERFDMSTLRSILQWLADPNLAFLFISLGTLAIIYEFANPGIGAGGAAGVILLVLAFFSLSVLPVNVAGALLMLLAAALFVGEMFVPGIGVMAAGGVVALVLGGVFLFRGNVEIDWWVLYPTAAVVGGGAAVIARFAWGTRRMPSVSGADAFLGRTTEVRSVRDGRAQVFIEGALWQARRAGGGALEPGQTVRVVDRDGLDLVVEAGRDEPGADVGATGQEEPMNGADT